MLRDLSQYQGGIFLATPTSSFVVVRVNALPDLNRLLREPDYRLDALGELVVYGTRFQPDKHNGGIGVGGGRQNYVPANPEADLDSRAAAMRELPEETGKVFAESQVLDFTLRSHLFRDLRLKKRTFGNAVQDEDYRFTNEATASLGQNVTTIHGWDFVVLAFTTDPAESFRPTDVKEIAGLEPVCLKDLEKPPGFIISDDDDLLAAYRAWVLNILPDRPPMLGTVLNSIPRFKKPAAES